MTCCPSCSSRKLYEQMVYVLPWKWDAQTSLGFWDTNKSFNIGQIIRPSESQKKKKRISRIVDYAVPTDHLVKLKENEKWDKYQDFDLLLNWKNMEHESDVGTNSYWPTWYCHQSISTGDWETWNKESRDHPNNSQNTKKSPRHLRWLAVTRTRVENH